MRRAPVALVALALALGACTLLQTSEYSAPRSAGPGMQVFGSSVLVELPGLWIELTARNRRVLAELVGPWPLPPFIPFPQDEPPARVPPLWLELRLDPEGETCAVVPMRISLLDAEGRHHEVSGFFGPAFRTLQPGLSPTERRRPWLEAGSPDLRTDPVEFKLSEATGFWLRFDVSPDPAHPFTVVLDGITRAGEPVEVPPIRFEREETRDFGIIP